MHDTGLGCSGYPGDISRRVTSRAEADEAIAHLLRKTQQRLREAQRIANLGSWEWDITTGELWWSDQIFTIFGMDSANADINYNLFLTFVHPDDIDSLEAAIRDAREGVRPYDIEHRIVRPDGEVRFLHERAETFRDEAGNATHMSGTVLDITERQMAREALLASESRFARIIDIAPEAIITIDNGSRIQVFNKSAERTFGYRAGEVVGRHIEMLIPERLRKEHARHVEAFKASEDSYHIMDRRGDITGLRKDGVEFAAAASVAKHLSSDEPLFIVMLHDVTDTRHAEARMREQEEKALALGKKLNMLERTSALGMMVAAIAHELYQPITALTLYTRRLLKGANAWRDAPEGIVSSLAEIDRLSVVINKVVQSVRNTVQQSENPSQIIRCADAIRGVLSLHEKELASAGIDATVTETTSGLCVMTDPLEFDLIILNLLRNAIDALTRTDTMERAGKEPQIDIRIDVEAQWNVRISIADNGPGIPPSIQEQLFEAFSSTKEAGWGMGLAICRQFAEDMGGNLMAMQNRSKGTTMVLDLPRFEGSDPDA
ncbi:MAG: PAS domain S-box protein [Rhodospirillales bacterium]